MENTVAKNGVYIYMHMEHPVMLYFTIKFKGIDLPTAPAQEIINIFPQ